MTQIFPHLLQRRHHVLPPRGQVFEQMRGEAMPQGVARHPLIHPLAAHRSLQCFLQRRLADVMATPHPRSARVDAHGFEILLERAQVVEADGDRLYEGSRRMGVAVDEAREDHFPSELDDPAFRPYEGLDSRVVAHVEDRAASDGERLRPAFLRVQSVDGPVSEHPVRFGSGAAGGKEKEKQNQSASHRAQILHRGEEEKAFYS